MQLSSQQKTQCITEKKISLQYAAPELRRPKPNTEKKISLQYAAPELRRPKPDMQLRKNSHYNMQPFKSRF